MGSSKGSRGVSLGLGRHVTKHCATLVLSRLVLRRGYGYSLVRTWPFPALGVGFRLGAARVKDYPRLRALGLGSSGLQVQRTHLR